MILIDSSSVIAQPAQRAALLEIVHSDVFFIRQNTNSEFLIADRAITVVGIGDVIRTGRNGRAIVTIAPSMEILLLPNTSYRIVDFTDDEFRGYINGIAVHRFEPDAGAALSYMLETEQLSLIAQQGHFSVWGIEQGLNAVVSSAEPLQVNFQNATYTVDSGMGFAPHYATSSIPLLEPYHAAQVVEKAVACEGYVQTNGSEGLRLRAGAALDFNILTVKPDDERVNIVGITENGWWYRIPFQSGFGWMFSSLIEADCDHLQVFPNLFAEVPERINNATEREIELLAPYYSVPLFNPTFYR